MQNTPVQVEALEHHNMPAARAGLKPNDKIAAIDGLQLHSVAALLAYLQDQAGKPAALIHRLRNGAAQLSHHRSRRNSDVPRWQQGLSSWLHPGPASGQGRAPAVRQGYGGLLGVQQEGLLAHRRSSQAPVHSSGFGEESLQSPIGIGQQIHQAAQMPGWMPLIGLMAYISLNLGIFNLLPIPILDGGMILFLLIESIMRRDVNQQLKERVYQVAFVCLLVFAVWSSSTTLPSSTSSPN